MRILRGNRRFIPKYKYEVAKETGCYGKIEHDEGQPTSITHPQLMNEGEITPGISSDEYIKRREKLLKLLPENALAIIASAPVKMMNKVVPYTFRQDADYLYITGCQQPGGIAVMRDDCGLCMFMPLNRFHGDFVDALWKGHIAGIDEAQSTFKADLVYPTRALNEVLREMINSSSQVFHNVNTANSAYMNLVSFQKEAFHGRVKDIANYTHEARWIKSAAELKLMRESASISSEALLKTMLHSRSFPNEGMLSAMFEYECRMKGAQRMAFNPVVGGGPNASVIRYSRNDQRILEGDMVKMEVGCELHGYASDVSRTWAHCGGFSPAQEELYDLILQTSEECLRLCRPGTSIREIHNYAERKLQKGFQELGILKSDDILAYRYRNPCCTGHYVGMDVHDCDTITIDRPLEPGVVITIETGVFIHPYLVVPERYKRGMGISIKDEVLITETGYEVLTGSVPKEIKHLESFLNHRS